MDFGHKKICEIDLFDFTNFFGLDYLPYITDNLFSYYRKRIKNSGPILLPELNERPKRKDWKKKKPKDLEKLKNNPIKVPLIQLQDNSFPHLLNSRHHQEEGLHPQVGVHFSSNSPLRLEDPQEVAPLSMVGETTQC